MAVSFWPFAFVSPHDISGQKFIANGQKPTANRLSSLSNNYVIDQPNLAQVHGSTNHQLLCIVPILY